MRSQECETHSQSANRQQPILSPRHYKTLTGQLELRSQQTATSSKIMKATKTNDDRTSSLSPYWVVASFLGGTVASFHTACQASSWSNPVTLFLTASAMRESAWVPIMILVSAMFFHIGSQPLWTKVSKIRDRRDRRVLVDSQLAWNWQNQVYVRERIESATPMLHGKYPKSNSQCMIPLHIRCDESRCRMLTSIAYTRAAHWGIGVYERQQCKIFLSPHHLHLRLWIHLISLPTVSSHLQLYVLMSQSSIRCYQSYLIWYQVFQVQGSSEPGRWIWMKCLPGLKQWKVSGETGERMHRRQEVHQHHGVRFVGLHHFW